ncbi:hypothetical protein Tco_0690290 [Tanacetum coccineum]
MQTVAGDGATSKKRRRRDLSGDSVLNLETESQRSRLKEDLESSTQRRRRRTLVLVAASYVVFKALKPYCTTMDPCFNSSKIKDILKAARDRQKSYANKRRKPLEFSVGDYVSLKVSIWKGVVRFGKKGKLAPRFVKPFEIIEKVGLVAYRLDLTKELDGVHDTFHVSNLKKCLAEPTLQVPLDEIRVDAKLNFVEESVEILE